MISTIHNRAHGQIQNDVVEVNQTEIVSVMGRITAIPTDERDDGRMFDKGLRTIMFTDLVRYNVDDESAWR
jgi:hypothetical protein